jgi:hypothetical protein
MGTVIRRVIPNWEHPKDGRGRYIPLYDRDYETEIAMWIEEPTWYQVYENVTEGTPVTPPFATKEALIFYLCNYGTFRGDGRKWSQEVAENFVNGSGYLPSMATKCAQSIDLTQQHL